ncbi:MAG TPA: ABC transporter ATP-binding protein [Jiangellaceae bacterium]
MEGSPAVEVSSLVKRYGGPAGGIVAVNRLSFTAERAAITALLGPNGAGKTTTVECCEGYRRADSGAVRVLGRDPWQDGLALRPRVGVMLQEGAGLYPAARPGELLRHLARLHAHPLDVGLLIDRLGLGGTLRTPIRRLSGGQRQRVALAAALVGRPELVFLDEPTAGLDPQARRATWELMEQLRSDGVSIILTTHLMDEVERLADYVVIVDQGRLVAEGSPSSLTADGAEGIVQFDGPPGLDVASLAAGLPGSVRVTEVSGGRYIVDGEITPDLLAALTAWCAARGVLAQGLQVGRRTLEDVFLELTGKELR